MAEEGVKVLLNEMLDPENILNNLLYLSARIGDDMTCGYIFNHHEPNVNTEQFDSIFLPLF